MANVSENISALISLIASSARRSELAVRLGQSLEITDGLWELVAVVTAVGETHDQLSAGEIAEQSYAARLVPAERRAYLEDLARRFLDATSPEDYLTLPAESDLSSLKVAEVMADPYGTLGGMFDQQAYFAGVLSHPAAGDLVGELLAAPADEQAFVISYLQAATRVPRTPALLRALFVAAISAVEPLVTRFVTVLLFDRAPTSYSSMADPALEKQARAQCFGGPDKWRAALVSSLHVAKAAEAVDWDRLQLLWEQRNVVVHRGGLADSRYTGRTGADAGTVVSPDADAVRDAIDEIGAARYGLAAAVWSYFEPDMAPVISNGTFPYFASSFQAGRWRQASGLARAQMALASEQTGVASAQVNMWLAIDLGTGPDAIRAEVEAWDVTCLPPEYGMARQLLLRQDDVGLATLRDLLDSGELSREDLRDWILFKRLRDGGRLDELLGRA